MIQIVQSRILICASGSYSLLVELIVVNESKCIIIKKKYTNPEKNLPIIISSVLHGRNIV